jgi:hypothetical protein
MGWTKQPAIDPKDLYIGCLNCSTATMKAPMDMPIAVGFGMASLMRDGEVLYDEMQVERGERKDWMTVGEAEAMAAADPDHDWQIVKHGPLHGETFQRHGPEEWVCIESNMGFA